MTVLGALEGAGGGREGGREGERGRVEERERGIIIADHERKGRREVDGRERW